MLMVLVFQVFPRSPRIPFPVDLRTTLNFDPSRSFGIDKPFTCDICGKKMCSNQSLKNHKVSVHAGIKPYECQFCQLKFVNQSNQRRHIKNIHLQTPDPGIGQS
eukprot:GHVT01010710.1.p1 GENE.GHVT01010710.1~~GHVT01010710.1.p1  ORF type:complete len:104 (+),score=2.63 GHVT01010710.1:34-345(+)